MEKCYPANRNTPLAVAGYILLAAGILILFVCILNYELRMHIVYLQTPTI